MKRKFSLFLNIATMVLCVCAIAIGVYSAKTANLTVSGTVGFVAHDCEVDIVGEIKNASCNNIENTYYVTEVTSTASSPTLSTTSSTISLGGANEQSKTATFGNLMFTYNDDHDAKPIVIEFTITNKSAFPISAKIDISSFSLANGIDKSVDHNKVYIDAKDSSDTSYPSKKIILSITTASQESITAGAESGFSFSFEKVPTLSAAGFGLSAHRDGALAVAPAKTTSDTLVIPAYFCSETTNKLVKYKTIMGTYDVTPMTNANQYAHIVIEEGIEEIRGDAFYGLSNLVSVYIPDSVTNISTLVFAQCSNLSSVRMSANIQLVNDNNTFSGTKYITDATAQSPYVSNNVIYFTDSLDGNGKKVLAYALLNKNVTTVTIDASAKAIAGSMFYNCTNLASITIPSSVTGIGDSTFWGCTGLTSITIPSSVTTIGDSAFHGCTGLTSITIPSSVTAIKDFAFYGCTGLTGTLTIPNGVTSIGGWCFANCSNLTSIISDSVTSIGYKAFNGCTRLTSIIIPSSVTSIGWCAFEDCTALSELKFSEAGTWEYSSSYNFATIIGTKPFNTTDSYATFFKTSGTSGGLDYYWRKQVQANG